VAGLVRRIFLGQFAPLYACTRDPQNSVKYGPRVLPRSSSRLWKANDDQAMSLNENSW
jgi:hypothetical protein